MSAKTLYYHLATGTAPDSNEAGTNMETHFKVIRGRGGTSPVILRPEEWDGDSSENSRVLS